MQCLLAWTLARKRYLRLCVKSRPGSRPRSERCGWLSSSSSLLVTCERTETQAVFGRESRFNFNLQIQNSDVPAAAPERRLSHPCPSRFPQALRAGTPWAAALTSGSARSPPEGPAGDSTPWMLGGTWGSARTPCIPSVTLQTGWPSPGPPRGLSARRKGRDVTTRFEKDRPPGAPLGEITRQEVGEM